jgi:hypothetical protein
VVIVATDTLNTATASATTTTIGTIRVDRSAGAWGDDASALEGGPGSKAALTASSVLRWQ